MTTALLSPDEVQAFQKNGYYLYHRQLFSPTELDTLNAIFEEHRAAEPDKRGDEFDTPHFEDRRLLDFLLAPQVLDLVECLLGPDIALWSSHFIAKDPLIGRATPWHEDSSYWNGRMDRFDQIVTVWLALDDVDEANGCMQVISGSHLEGGFSEYRPVDRSANTFGSEVIDVDLDRAVSFVLRRGESSLHDGRIIHGAHPNTSDRRRLGYTMRYVSASSHVYYERRPEHRLWLARGHAIAPNVYENA